MKAGALTDSTTDLPEAQVVIELPNGHRVIATGFIIQEDSNRKPIIIIKAGKTAAS